MKCGTCECYAEKDDGEKIDIDCDIYQYKNIVFNSCVIGEEGIRELNSRNMAACYFKRNGEVILNDMSKDAKFKKVKKEVNLSNEFLEQVRSMQDIYHCDNWCKFYDTCDASKASYAVYAENKRHTTGICKKQYGIGRMNKATLRKKIDLKDILKAKKFREKGMK